MEVGETPATCLRARDHAEGSPLDIVLSTGQSSCLARSLWLRFCTGPQAPKPLGCPPAVLGKRCNCGGEAGHLLSAWTPHCGHVPARLGGGTETETRCHHPKPQHRGREMGRQLCRATSSTSCFPAPGGIRGLYTQRAWDLS